MAPPLLKYRRPPEIEVAIDDALQLGPVERLRRAGLPRSNADALRNEVLIHLIRAAIRADDMPAANALVALLLRRCAAKVRKRSPEADEVLSELAELIARDHRMDFFECKFDLAISTLRKEVRAKQLKANRELSDRDAQSDSADDEPSLGTVALDPNEFGRLCEAVEALEPDLREAFMLVRVHRMKIESKNPDETTAASIAGVTSRTIRNRVAEARKQLKARLGDLS